MPPFAAVKSTRRGRRTSLLPFMEQNAIYQQATGNSWNVRTGAVEDLRLPDGT